MPHRVLEGAGGSREGHGGASLRGTVGEIERLRSQLVETTAVRFVFQLPDLSVACLAATPFSSRLCLLSFLLGLRFGVKLRTYNTQYPPLNAVPFFILPEEHWTAHGRTVRHPPVRGLVGGTVRGTKRTPSYISSPGIFVYVGNDCVLRTRSPATLVLFLS